MRALEPGGFADSLVEFGRSGQYCLDLQLRRNPKSSQSWATLYVGTTKVLDLKLRERSGRFWLDAHGTYTTERHGWDEAWKQPHPATWWPAQWPRVEAYLESVITAVRDGYGKEGRIQSSLSLYPATDMAVIDRETVVGYADTPARTRVIRRHLDALMDSIVDAGTERWWKPKAPGNECDGLAISAAGELLAIEVKPANVANMVWAPLQALHYADLLQHWADETPDAAEVLEGMYQQRLQLGLLRPAEAAPQLKNPVTVRAVVAIGGDLSPVWHDRLRLVAERLEQAGRSVDYRRVNLVGRMDPLPLTGGAPAGQLTTP